MNFISNAKNLLEKIRDTADIKKLLTTLESNSEIEFYLVGGIVRDAFLGQAGQDLDLACNFKPEKILNFLENEGYKIVPTGITHGTISVILESGNVEITTFRQAGARTSNKYAEDIKTDLLGRDFTINAIAYSFKDKEFIDPYGGIKDLENKILRSPGSALERMQEDPLRIMRMLRFGPANKRVVDPSLLEACKATCEKLKNVSPERIQHELCLILLCPEVREALNIAKSTGILETIIPEVQASYDCLQNDFHTEDVFEHTLTVVERSEKILLHRLAALFHDLGKPATLSVDENGRRHFYKHEEISAEIAETVMQRLRFSKQITQATKKIVAYHMRPLECGPAAIRRLMRDLDDLFNDWLLFKQADKPPTMPEIEFENLYTGFKKLYAKEKERAAGKPYGKLAVNGEDLIALGLKSGPKLGSYLKKMEEQVLENPDNNTYDYLINLAKAWLEEN